MLQADCNVAGCKHKASTLALMRSQTAQVSEAAFCKDHSQHVCGGYLVPNPAAFVAGPGLPTYVECWLRAVFFVYEEFQRFSLVLNSIDGKFAMLVQTGYPEACLVYHAVKKSPSPTPPTHQLMGAIVQALGGSVIEAVVEGYDTETKAYKCHLAVRTINRVVDVACRGSDAVALSLFTPFPIRVNSTLMGTDLSVESDVLK